MKWRYLLQGKSSFWCAHIPKSRAQAHFRKPKASFLVIPWNSAARRGTWGWLRKREHAKAWLWKRGGDQRGRRQLDSFVFQGKSDYWLWIWFSILASFRSFFDSFCFVFSLVVIKDFNKICIEKSIIFSLKLHGLCLVLFANLVI